MKKLTPGSFYESMVQALSVSFLIFAISGCGTKSPEPERYFEVLREGQFEKLAAMIKKDGSKANLVGEQGYSLLHLTVMSGNVELATLLLAEGADLGLRAPTGHTALHLALQKGDTEMVKVLLAAGADVMAINPKDRNATSLQYAAVAGPVENARLIVEKGFDVNAVDGVGANALNWASWLGSLDMVEYLVSAGCDLDNVDKYGDSPLDAAAKNEKDPDRTILKYLQSLENE